MNAKLELRIIKTMNTGNGLSVPFKTWKCRKC